MTEGSDCPIEFLKSVADLDDPRQQAKTLSAGGTLAPVSVRRHQWCRLLGRRGPLWPTATGVPAPLCAVHLWRAVA